MNDPVVAAAWREEGDLAKHRAYLQNIDGDPHVIALIASLDDRAFGYFEVYWAKEDRIAPFYDADDFDRGWHVLIGEPSFRGKPFVTAWLPSISHYLFLNDCRTQRIVIEPRSDNYKMIRNLGKCGYVNLKEFGFLINAPRSPCCCGKGSSGIAINFRRTARLRPLPYPYPEAIAMHIHDLIGIGFGPSNIALAITLEEKRQEGYDVDSFFIEKQPGFAWHANMMLDNTHMQISFLKDLATMRNPSSHFTFINYLHRKQRLQDFINLKTFFPSRHEFNDYLKWAASISMIAVLMAKKFWKCCLRSVMMKLRCFVFVHGMPT